MRSAETLLALIKRSENVLICDEDRFPAVVVARQKLQQTERGWYRGKSRYMTIASMEALSQCIDMGLVKRLELVNVLPPFWYHDGYESSRCLVGKIFASNIKEIVFCHEDIWDVHTAIVDFVRRECVVELRLSNSGLCDYLVERFVHSCKGNCTLKILDFSKNHIMDKGAEDIACLMAVTNLQVVDLGDNMIRESGTISLLKATVFDSHVLELKIGNTVAPSESSVGVLVELVKNNRCLKKLHLESMKNFAPIHWDRVWRAVYRHNLIIEELSPNPSSSDSSKQLKVFLDANAKLNYAKSRLCTSLAALFPAVIVGIGTSNVSHTYVAAKNMLYIFEH